MSYRNNTLTINVDCRALDHLDQHVLTHQPFLTRHRAAWVALNLGLELLGTNPELLVQFLERESGKQS